MQHLGDITRIEWKKISPVDVVTGGSPCQDLSIAGKRLGLAGERSGLYMDQIRCVKELRQIDKNRGRADNAIRPRYMVWENVPGAFSSNKGKDFAAVLEEAIRIIEPGIPAVPVPAKGWPRAGCLHDMDGRWSVAWRVHDAQFWGVPQRRRRIALVCDFGGMSAPEILFERKGVPRDSEKGREARQEIDARTRSCAAAAGNGGDRNGQGGSVMDESIGLVGTLRANMHGNNPIVVDGFQLQAGGKCAVFMPGQGAKAGGIAYSEKIAPTLKASASGTNMVPAVLYTGSKCLQDKDGNIGPDTQKPICMATDQSNSEVLVDVSPTLLSGHVHPLLLHPQIVGTLCGSGAGLSRPAGMSSEIDLCIVSSVDCRNLRVTEEKSGTLQSKANGGYSLNYQNPIYIRGEVLPKGSEDPEMCTLVRRLTPLECERLMGYPDGWTDIGDFKYKNKKGKLVTATASDCVRYKALGNSIALPFWHWLLERISAQYDGTPTLGSLFDGIGGFPLCWERINGKGTALWASEIEEFPIAVTKFHFPEQQIGYDCVEAGDLCSDAEL